MESAEEGGAAPAVLRHAQRPEDRIGSLTCRGAGPHASAAAVGRCPCLRVTLFDQVALRLFGRRFRLNLDVAASLFPELPDVDDRRLHAEPRQGGAHLAPVIGPVVERLGEPDAYRGATLEAVVVALEGDGVGIGGLR